MSGASGGAQDRGPPTVPPLNGLQRLRVTVNSPRLCGLSVLSAVVLQASWWWGSRPGQKGEQAQWPRVGQGVEIEGALTPSNYRLDPQFLSTMAP